MFSKFIAWKFKCFVYKNKQSSYIVPNYLKLAKKKCQQQNQEKAI